MIAPTPAAFKQVTACSRDDPQPQFLPPTTMSFGRTSLAKRGSRSSSAWAAVSAGLLIVYVYLPGKMTSVFTLSPYFQTRPRMVGISTFGQTLGVFRPYGMLRDIAYCVRCCH